MHANLHISAITRGTGRNAAAASAYRSGSSVVACAAYRACDKLNDQRYEKTHDYTKKHNVLHAEIVTPAGAPEWMKDRGSLWNAVEAGEKRKDAQLAKEVVLVLPRNLDHEQHKEVVRGWIADNITKRGLVADFAIHEPDASDGGKNPHAHVMFTLRPVEGEGFGKKLTGYKDGGLDGREVLEDMRFSYEHHLNIASAANDNNQVVFNLRSYREKGIDREPQKKIGAKVNYLEKRGYVTDWAKECRKQMHRNNNKPYQKYVGSYHLIGDGGKNSSNFLESVRADIAEKYYDVMYGEDRGVEEWNDGR
jgi:ATP-dependent exoDNAse (exonuclease V) alpha subunit